MHDTPQPCFTLHHFVLVDPINYTKVYLCKITKCEKKASGGEILFPGCNKIGIITAVLI